MTNLHYRITPVSPEAHLFEVRLTVKHPVLERQLLRLPTWIPGSYKIRDFSKHLCHLEASSEAGPLAIEKIDNHSWQVASCSSAWSVTYQVYAWDRSVRTAHLDQTHGFFNGSSVFLEVVGHMGPLDISIEPHAQYRYWYVATAMPRLAVDAQGFGTYTVSDYDASLDFPVEMGTFDQKMFIVNEVPHYMVISGRHNGNVSRLLTDVTFLCQTVQELMGLPNIDWPHYYFLLSLDENSFGGLEHRNSTALMSPRHHMPIHSTVTIDYAQLLSLCCHEYFHSWLVKRIKPAAFCPYDLTRPNITRQLWAFEGITAYYDKLLLVRAGCISVPLYLEMLGKTIQQYLQCPGRLVQSVTDASFDAWTKFYQPDENTDNSSVSYYVKGALIALCADILLRLEGHYTLDTLLQHLWQRYGNDLHGVPEGQIEALLEELGGLSMQTFIHQALYTVSPLPLEDLLAAVGVGIDFQSEPLDTGDPLKIFQKQYGLKCDKQNGLITIQSVSAKGPMETAGVAAGDVLLAIDGLKLTSENLRVLCLQGGKVKNFSVMFFRQDILMQAEILVQPADWNKLVLQLADIEDAETLHRRESWLGL